MQLSGQYGHIRERLLIYDWFATTDLDIINSKAASFILAVCKQHKGKSGKVTIPFLHEIQNIWYARSYELENGVKPMAFKGKTNWTFAKVDLSSEERDHFVGWLGEFQDDILELLSDAIRQGYKFSAVYDNENPSWMATLTADQHSRHNSQCSMTSRHGSLEQATMLTLYKNSVLSQNGPWRSSTADQDWG